MEGWISLQRKFLAWRWFDDDAMVRFFIYLLLKANHADADWFATTIKRGQLVTSIDTISRELHKSAQQVRTMIKRLKSTSEITSESTNKYTIITICKYDYYQNLALETNKQTNKQTNKRATNGQQTNNKRITTNNNDNNDNNVNNIVDSIESGENENADKSATRKQPAKTLEEREKDFMWKIAEVGKGVYPDEMLRAFFDYWSEHNENGKKMLFEMKKTFDIKKRLATWASRENDNQFKHTSNGNRNNPNSADYVSTERIVAAGLAMANANR